MASLPKEVSDSLRKSILIKPHTKISANIVIRTRSVNKHSLFEHMETNMCSCLFVVGITYSSLPGLSFKNDLRSCTRVQYLGCFLSIY